MTSVIVERPADAAEFLAATEQLRAADPVMTNVLSSVAQGVLDGRRYESLQWWVVRDGSSEVVGAALRTAPYLVLVVAMPDEAAHALAEAVAADDPNAPGAAGPAEVVDVVLHALGDPPVERMREIAHVVRDVVPPPATPGSLRAAGPADAPLLIDWSLAFHAETGTVGHDVAHAVRQRVEEGTQWLWQVAGEPVCLVGVAARVPTPAGDVARIGPVYTPPEHRGHGYAGAATGAVTAALLPHCAAVMLYTDAANPTSNGVYARLGYVPVGEIVEARRVGSPVPS